ncbi:hypothetical protein LX32DRAFT_335660 [Colletotrichum zoysiae]|uniref:Uncharacterized protein n=1 Tax=Colletotrichum zoysiae TaxID=1216348 RepID=A0AAD9M243_9PEZI|nr:hypothetical protein LX32DRAFT_335660 [Colletotrichum zoysiae]
MLEPPTHGKTKGPSPFVLAPPLGGTKVLPPLFNHLVHHIGPATGVSCDEGFFFFFLKFFLVVFFSPCPFSCSFFFSSLCLFLLISGEEASGVAAGAKKRWRDSAFLLFSWRGVQNRLKAGERHTRARAHTWTRELSRVATAYHWG